MNKNKYTKTDKADGTISLYSSLQLTEQMEGLDRQSKLILTQIPVLAVILKHCVREFEKYSVQDVERFISLEKTPTSISGEYRNKYVSVGVQSPTEIKASGGLQECADENVSKADAHSAARTLGAFLNMADSISASETEVSYNRTNQVITGDNTEFPALNEQLSTFDILFHVINPLLSTATLSVQLHVNLESQKDYRPGYPIEKRGIYHLARNISAQIPVVTKNTNYGTLEKCYSIFICRDRIPEQEQYTVTKWSFDITKDSTYTDIKKEQYDLMELIIIRLGEEFYNGTTQLLDFLNILFYPHKDNFVERLKQYIDISNYKSLEQEAVKMTGLGESVLEEGIARGRLESKKEDILDLLEDIGTIPDYIEQVIRKETNLDKLNLFLKLAARSESFETFCKKAGL